MDQVAAGFDNESPASVSGILETLVQLATESTSFASMSVRATESISVARLVPS